MRSITIKNLLSALTLFSALGLSVTPSLAEPLVYVAAGSANRILVIDAATDKVVNEYDGVDNPHAVVATPDGEYVMAGSLKEKRDDKNIPRSTLYLVHPAHGHVMSTLPATGMIHHQAITPDGKYVISTHPTQSGISYADMLGDGTVKSVKTGPGANYAVLTPDGARAYVSNTGNATISEIDTKTWTVVRNLEGGPGPEHIAMSKDGKFLYVANARAGKVSAISIQSGKVVRQYDIGKKVHGLDISDDGSTLFVTSKGENKLVVLDPKTDQRRVVSLAPEPYHLQTIPGTGKVYVSSSKEPRIWVIDQRTGTLTGEIAIKGEGHQMATVHKNPPAQRGN